MLSGMSGSNGVVLRKLALLEEVLGELRSAGTPGPEVLAEILEGHLEDFTRFREEVLAYVGRDGSGGA